jgi:hypothetical protein
VDFCGAPILAGAKLPEAGLLRAGVEALGFKLPLYSAVDENTGCARNQRSISANE